MDMHNLNEAGKLCDRILSISPEHGQARTMGDAIKSRFGQARQFYETIKNGIGSQSLERLSTLLGEAVEIYPDHPDGRLVQTQLLSITREYKNAMREGAQAVGEGRWDEAQRSFEKARELNPGFSSIARLVDFMSDVRRKVKSARGNIDAAIQRKNWRKAMSLARAVDQYVEGIKQMAIDY